MRRSALTLVYAVTLAPLTVTGALWHQQRSAESSEIAAASVPATTHSSVTQARSEQAVWYAPAAQAFLAGDLAQVRTSLGELASLRPVEGARAYLVWGLYELAAGELANALETLAPLQDAVPELEDWRLFGVAESAARLGASEVAAGALDRLLEAFPSSPLRGKALLTAAEIAWEAGDAAAALSLIARGRESDLAGEIANDLEALAWKIGGAIGDDEIQRQAAHHLLIHAPMITWRLDVTDMFRDPQGRITSWDGILTTEEVQMRAESWLRAGRPLHAQRSLETVPSRDRGARWEILMARSLTAQDKGAEAYSRLQKLQPRTPAERRELEWERATAAASQATGRGQQAASAADRRRMVAVTKQHLRHLVALSPPAAEAPPESARLIRAALARHGNLDQNLEILRLLRELDPSDRTGAALLWDRGWEAFSNGDLAAAVTAWSHLDELYPEQREAHRGRYWKARALESQGQHRRAAETYRSVVRTADTVDFYARQAASRLQGELPSSAPGALAAPWPEDPRLARVLLLADLGLTPLARQELELLEKSSHLDTDSRDILALRGILTVREGRPRQGVLPLRAAFPVLGGPFQATVPLPVLEAYYPMPWADQIRGYAEAADLPVSLVAGIIRQESAFDPRAESWAGARGLMQLMPATAREMAGKLGEPYSPVRLFDPEVSIRLGAHYFRWVLDRFDGNLELALAGYNGGPNRIRRLWNEAGGGRADLDWFVETLGIQESQDYVKRILVLADSYRQLYPEEPVPTPPGTALAATPRASL